MIPLPPSPPRTNCPSGSLFQHSLPAGNCRCCWWPMSARLLWLLLLAVCGPVRVVLAATHVHLHTCRMCVDAGHKWAQSQCHEECLMDTACYTNPAGCMRLRRTQSIADVHPTCKDCLAAGHQWTFADRHGHAGRCGTYCSPPCEPFCPDDFPSCPARPENCYQSSHHHQESVLRAPEPS